MNEWSGPLFLSVAEAAKITGLSKKHLRDGCKAGEIACLVSGSGNAKKFLINGPRLFEMLDERSREQGAKK